MYMCMCSVINGDNLGHSQPSLDQFDCYTSLSCCPVMSCYKTGAALSSQDLTYNICPPSGPLYVNYSDHNPLLFTSEAALLLYQVLLLLYFAAVLSPSLVRSFLERINSMTSSANSELFESFWSVAEQHDLEGDQLKSIRENLQQRFESPPTTLMAESLGLEALSDAEVGQTSLAVFGAKQQQQELHEQNPQLNV